MHWRTIENIRTFDTLFIKDLNRQWTYTIGGGTREIDYVRMGVRATRFVDDAEASDDISIGSATQSSDDSIEIARWTFLSVPKLCIQGIR